MNLEYTNQNYAAQIVQINRLVELENCDNVIAFPIFGYQAITSKDAKVGDLVVVFTAETQLSEEFCKNNNLFRKSELNSNIEKKGYLEENRRVKAVKFRGHKSSALIMPLNSLSYIGDISELKEGDIFDTINGQSICKKYVNRHNQKSGVSTPKEKAVARVDTRSFPEHIDSENYFRNSFKIKPKSLVIVSQKLHGTSGRWGNIKVRKQLNWKEKIAKFFKVPIDEFKYEYVAGSRRVIKSIGDPTEKVHFYDTDIWSKVLVEIQDAIPKDTILYGELVGWVGEREIQKNYTYGVPKGEYKLYIYRIAHVDDKGFSVDYSWEAMKEFCLNNGLNYCPELWTGTHSEFETLVDSFLDTKYLKNFEADNRLYNEKPIGLDSKSVCDEGVCIRVEGLSPFILKAKSPEFLGHESKQLDTGEVDIESEEAEVNELPSEN